MNLILIYEKVITLSKWKNIFSNKKTEFSQFLLWSGSRVKRSGVKCQVPSAQCPVPKFSIHILSQDQMYGDRTFSTNDCELRSQKKSVGVELGVRVLGM